MIRTGIFFLVGCFLLLSLGGCQSDSKNKSVSTPKVMARYFVQYLQSNRVFRSEARFFSGDSLASAVPIKVNSVSFQGGSMDIKTAPKEPAFYKTERAGAFQTDLRFKYTLGSEEVTTDLHLDPIASFLIKGDVSKTKGLSIVWDGLPLMEEENLLLFIADKNNKAASTTLLGPTDRAEAHMGGAFLAELQKGEGKIFLVRKRKGLQVKDNTTCQFELEYYTPPIGIQILP